jgi:hypothetical protein
MFFVTRGFFYKGGRCPSEFVQIMIVNRLFYRDVVFNFFIYILFVPRNPESNARRESEIKNVIGGFFSSYRLKQTYQLFNWDVVSNSRRRVVSDIYSSWTAAIPQYCMHTE